MKKPLFIIAGIVVIFLVLGLWAYLMFFNTDETGTSIFSNFGFDITEQPENPILIDPVNPDPDVLIDVSGEALRQLTLRPVAGFTVVSSTSSLFVRYAENGTGHIYEINLDSGEERRISGTTIPRVTEAYFSTSGEYVALVSESGYIRETFFGRIEISGSSGSVVGRSLPINIENISVGDNTISYSTNTTTGSGLFTFNGETLEQNQSQSLSLQDVIIYQSGSEVFVHPKSSELLEGSLYKATNNSLEAVTPSSFGFVGFPTSDHFITTETDGEVLYGVARAQIFPDLIELAIVPLPEKCDAIGSTLWCASPSEQLTPDYIENWYKGNRNSQDIIWETNLVTGISTLKIDLFSTSNRPIDVTQMNEEGGVLYFVNKIDGTLWQYDLIGS